MLCIRLPPSDGKSPATPPYSSSLLSSAFALCLVHEQVLALRGSWLVWVKPADVEVIMTLKVLSSLTLGLFPDFMCSVSGICCRTTSAQGAWAYYMCVCVDDERWKDHAGLIWSIPCVQLKWYSQPTRHPNTHWFSVRESAQIFLVSDQLICQPQISLFPVFVSLLFTPVSLSRQ